MEGMPTNNEEEKLKSAAEIAMERVDQTQDEKEIVFEEKSEQKENLKSAKDIATEKIEEIEKQRKEIEEDKNKKNEESQTRELRAETTESMQALNKSTKDEKNKDSGNEKNKEGEMPIKMSAEHLNETINEKIENIDKIDKTFEENSLIKKILLIDEKYGNKSIQNKKDELLKIENTSWSKDKKDKYLNTYLENAQLAGYEKRREEDISNMKKFLKESGPEVKKIMEILADNREINERLYYLPSIKDLDYVYKDKNYEDYAKIIKEACEDVYNKHEDAEATKFLSRIKKTVAIGIPVSIFAGMSGPVVADLSMLSASFPFFVGTGAVALGIVTRKIYKFLKDRKTFKNQLETIENFSEKYSS